MNKYLNKYLAIEPKKTLSTPKPGTIVMTASEVRATYERIAARLDTLEALLDERTQAHFEMNRRFEATERAVKAKRRYAAWTR